MGLNQDINCKCCGRMFVVKEGEIWFCFYCDPNNATDWRCPKSHTLLIISELENMVLTLFSQEHNNPISIHQSEPQSQPQLDSESKPQKVVAKRSQKTENGIEERTMFFRKCADFICDNIFLGDEWASLCKIEVFKDLNITHILCVGAVENYHQIHAEIQYCHILLKDIDTADLLSHVAQGIQFINSARPNNILVHCRAGQSRSASMVMAWLIVEKNMTYDQAYTFVEKQRPIIAPNPGFIAQLKRLANDPL